MEEPLVSVLLISYNQVRFIEESLESAIRQDYANLEIVASDDGSIDGTAQIIEGYALRHPGRVHALTGGPNLGITRNCNRALKECRGEYIAFLAGDDYYLPGKIRSQVEWFKKNPEAVLCGHQLQVVEQATGQTSTFTRKFTEGLGPTRWIEHGVQYGSLSIMIRSRVIPKRGFDERIPMVSDNKFWIDCLSGGGRYGYLENSFATYRKHQSNFTNDKLSAFGELELVFSVIESDYPQFRAECRRGRSNLIDYARGFIDLNRGCYRDAVKWFFAAWKNNPLNLKAPVRLVQTFSRMIFPS